MLIGLFFSLKGYKLVGKPSGGDKDWRLPIMGIVGPVLVLGALLNLTLGVLRRIQE